MQSLSAQQESHEFYSWEDVKEAGFHDIQTDTKNIWLCVKAVK
ncbi:hypothetical protein [Anaerolactibacter massiliensis]|nr:hypothetical protein [Anaerolactibacter massiliensis]MDD6365937.1 hypothetical protein [Stecheria intestinalis]MDY4681368.1 hypothetical protein [Lachnospiraceae bacterium]